MTIKQVLFVAASLIISATTFAQVNNFSVSEDGKAYWQKIYDVALAHDDLMNILVNDGNFADINDGDVITFRLNRAEVDVTKYGYTRMSVPMYVVNYDVSCFVTIQLKEDRYRVTVDNITLIRNLTTRMGKEGEEEALETWAVKKGQLSSGFTKMPSAIYDQYFSDRFLFQTKSYIDDEW